MGPPRSSKKRPQANRAHGRVKEILAPRRELHAAIECAVPSAWNQGAANPSPLRTADTTARTFQRILLLVSSGFPRVSNRTMTAMMGNAAIAIPMRSGVITLGFSGVGLGVGDAAGGGDAFFFASIDCAYCKRWKVSLSCGFTFRAA